MKKTTVLAVAFLVGAGYYAFQRIQPYTARGAVASPAAVPQTLREMDVLVMKAPQGDVKLRDGSGRGSTRVVSLAPKLWSMEMKSSTMENLCSNLALNLSMPVIDESGLTGRYDITLKSDIHNKDNVSRDAREQLGLVLKPERRLVNQGL